jgi:hypothetical protein
MLLASEMEMTANTVWMTAILFLYITRGCAGYLDHPFLKNETKQENGQAL